MAHRFLTAAHIHDGRNFLPAGSSLEVAADGRIISIHATAPENAEYFDGVLCPGFVNAHCHLELSHMQGIIPQGTGLIPFLQSVTRRRAGFTDEQKKAARHEAYAALVKTGVVALGDVANTTDTLDLRALGQLHTHTFVEAIGFTESGAAARLQQAQETVSAFGAQESGDVVLRQSIVPHAPYSVSPGLFRLIQAVEPGSLISIHNQESEAEDEYYRNKTGAVRDLLEGFGINDDFFQASGKSSLATYLPLLADNHQLLLVHNTCTNNADLLFAQQGDSPPFWCFCPSANLYIEGRLADVPMIAASTDNICIGTDSLASNKQLSILAELQVLHKAFALQWETLLRWGTSGGAAALNLENVVGRFGEGMKPGVLHLPSLGDDIVTRVI